ncbi:MAG: YlxR family protein [Desulfovibrionaceae bacterium]
MCVVCRRRLPKRELTRFTAPPERGVPPVEDPRQRRPGRGYYLCGEEACRERFQRFKGFRRKQGDSL